MPQFPYHLEGGVALTLARSLAVATLLLTFGTLVFRTVIAPRCYQHMPAVAVSPLDNRLLRLTRVAALAYLPLALLWLVLQSAAMSGASSLLQGVGAVPDTLVGTRFGHLIALEFVAVALVAAASGGQGSRARPWAALVLAAAAIALQAILGAGAGSGALIFTNGLHVAAAASWLGGLPPLFAMVREAPVRAAASAVRWFSRLGRLCVALLALTSALEGWRLVGGLPELLGTAYGLTASGKLVLFAVMLGFVFVGRYRFAPSLFGSNPERAKQRLATNIAVQAGLGLAIVVAAAALGELEPATHAQPFWPFASRLSLEAVRQDLGLRLQTIEAGGALVLAAVVLGVGLGWRRVRWPGIAGGLAIGLLALRGLEPLLAPASPTAFYRAPTAFAAAAIAAGAALYPGQCGSCHGLEGPGRLSAARLRIARDGDLFWVLTHGVPATAAGQGMPGFATLSEEQRWALIDFIRARGAGESSGGTGNWPSPVEAPGLQAQCGARTVTLADVRGRFVRLVFGPARSDPDTVMEIAPAPGAVTILAADRAPAGTCLADDATIRTAYAIISGLPAEYLAGAQFLIDGQGRLRAYRPAGWNDPDALSAAIDKLQRQPVSAAASGDAGADAKM